MNEKLQHLAKMWPVHLACAALAGGCAYLCTLPVVSSIPGAQEALMGVSGLVWGKYGFKPSKRLLALIIQAMKLDDLVQIKTMAPPPMSPTAAAAAPPPTAADVVPPTVPTPPTPPSS